MHACIACSAIRTVHLLVQCQRIRKRFRLQLDDHRNTDLGIHTCSARSDQNVLRAVEVREIPVLVSAQLELRDIHRMQAMKRCRYPC